MAGHYIVDHASTPAMGKAREAARVREAGVWPVRILVRTGVNFFPVTFFPE